MRGFRKVRKIMALGLAPALLMGIVPVSTVLASPDIEEIVKTSTYGLTDDFVLFDFTEKEIMKTSANSANGIFWTAPTDGDGHQTFRFVESEEDGCYYEFTNSDEKDDPFLMGTLGKRAFSSEYKYAKLMYRTTSTGRTSLYFWGSDEKGLGGDTSVSFTKTCDGNWNTEVTDLSVNKYWSGNILMFRLNTIKNNASLGDTFDLRYIALFKTKEEADAYEFIKGANFMTSKNIYDLGEQIDISYLNTSSGDWFGIFSPDADPASAEPIARADAEASEKVKSLALTSDLESLSAGDYKVCLLNSHNQVLRERSISIIRMADYSKLYEILEQVLDHSYYTDDTIIDFEEALSRVEYNLPLTEQDKLNTQISSVENAFMKLKLKDADYWDVESAIAKIPGDLTVYTSESIAELRQAQNSVEYGKTIDKQNEVNGYAQAIYAAIDNLVREKGAVSTSTNYSKINGALAGVDDLGRVLPMNDTVPNSREGERYVGVFYFLWQGQHGTSGPYDNSKLEKIEGALNSEQGWLAAGGGAVGSHHFWGEPLFGYYTSDDEWVMRKHVQMLTDADVDFLVFDATNGYTYTKQALKLMSILDEYQKAGWDVPQVVFYTNSNSQKTMTTIYNDIYKAHPEYSGLWFNWDGKPMIIGDESAATATVKSFFRIKANQWPNEAKKDDGFPWMEFGRSLTDDAVYGLNGIREIMNVSIAQHASTTRFSATAWYGANDSSRSWHNGANDTSDGAVNMGYNFAEQWEYAIAKDPQMIFITGWNEWVAQRQNGIPGEPIVFVDCANENNSRDAEPMKGGFGDNYYMQMINYIRKYKGTDPKVNIGGNKTIDIGGSFDQWNSQDVTAQYKDYAGDTAARNAVGFGYTVYRNYTGRNDIQNMKVARDLSNIYFYADTANDITEPTDHWMTLFLNTSNESHANWKGYDYVLNRVAPESGKAVLEKYDGKNWIKIASVDMKVEGNKLMLAVPRILLDLDAAKVNALNLQFKWADNYQDENDIWTFYEDGDAAPYGRLNYVFSGADEKNDYIPGDVNGDGAVNAKDIVRLMQYIANDGKNVTVTKADLNNDGKENAKDIVRLMQYIANDGEGVEIF